MTGLERDAVLRAYEALWGEKDPAFGSVHLDRWMSAFPHADVRRLPEIGHFVAEEDPASVARAIRGT